TAMLEARRQAEIARVAARDEGLARTRAERAELQAKEQLYIARAEKARADQENARALAANNFMRNLLGPPLSGSLLDKRAHLDLRVSEVLTGAEAALNGLDQHPQLELDGRLTLAAAFAATGTMDRARTQYQ